MHTCALRTDKVGLPTRPGNPVRFDAGMEHPYKNSGVRARRYTDASRS
jgi:hypothetical protein